jgi:UPF0271 protein
VARGTSAYAALVGAMTDCCDPGTALVLPAGAPAVRVAWDAALVVLEEGFCDRAYAADGTLVARSEAGSVYGDPERAAAQALRLARDGVVEASDGTTLQRHIDTLCIHGDSPNAARMAAAVRRALAGAGLVVAVPPKRT